MQFVTPPDVGEGGEEPEPSPQEAAAGRSAKRRAAAKAPTTTTTTTSSEVPPTEMQQEELLEEEEEEEEEEEAPVGGLRGVTARVTDTLRQALGTAAPKGRGRPAKKTKPTAASKKTTGAVAKKKAAGQRRRTRRVESYKRYIYRVLKQIHPDTGISSKAMDVMDSLMMDMFERIVSEASKMSLRSKRVTLSAREIQAAVKLILPGALAQHAVTEGSKAVVKMSS